MGEHARKKILFLAESVTLAQVVRLVSLARSLDPRQYELHFASSWFGDLVFRGTTFERYEIASVEPAYVARALRAGRRIYSKKMILRYVKDDLALFARVRPDLVVSDFRLSLAVSGPLSGISHAALINAYWSPFAERSGFPMPDHPIVRLLGEALAARHFPAAVQHVFAHFARPINEARRAYGLPPVGSLLEVLTFGEHVLYADSPSLVPTAGAPAAHVYLGPVPWAPDVPLPPFWDSMNATRPCVYVTLGSSGDVAALPVVVEALASLPVTAVVATAKKTHLGSVPTNVLVADFVPGDLAARRSSLVISNGGSSTGYQALGEGVPVLGIASNLDQYLAMTAIEKSGAGMLLRASTLKVGLVRQAVSLLLASDSHRRAALDVQRDFARWSFADRFREFVAGVTGRARPVGAVGEVGVRRFPGLASRMAAMVLIGTAVLVRTASAEPKVDQAPSSNEIRFGVSVTGAKGHVLCGLFRKTGWLKNPVQSKKATIQDGEAECVFSSVAADTYGVSAFHDENDNGRLDTNFLGLPTESWCTSRGAKGFFGPPSFDDAQFRFLGGVTRLRASCK